MALTAAQGWAVFLLAVLLYTVAVVLLRRSASWKKGNFSMMGPILMWRTKRGQGLLRSLARWPRFWKGFAALGVLTCFIIMVLMVFMLLISAVFIATQPDVEPVPPSQVLVLPGINPILPLWYGLLALIVAIVIHELSHGVLSIVGKMKVKSMGVLLCVIPVGAFVEPSARDMEKADRKVRRRVFAAGPMSNIVAALFFAMLFSWGFMASAEPVVDGILVLEVVEDSPADYGGIEPGMVIYTFNGSEVPDGEPFTEAIGDTHPNQTVIVQLLDGKQHLEVSVTLADKYAYYSGQNGYDPPESMRNTSFVGLHSRSLGKFQETLAHPFTSADSAGEGIINLLYYGALLPMNTQIMPLHAPLTDYYEVKGPLAALPEGVFWTMANAFYYLFWINLLLGMFNALPMVPLDGGPIFRDTYYGWLEKRKINITKKEMEIRAGKVTVFMALLIAGLLVFVLFVPYF